MTASDAPVREPGTRTRSGNAMARTRAALLDAAGECLGRYGIRKTTMVDVASRSRVAKATLYNHFRTKDDLLTAYVEDRVALLARTATATTARAGLAAALAELAAALAADPALRRAAAEEAAAIAPLATPGSARGWLVAREGAATVLAAARVEPDPGSVDVLLRWVLSQLLWPADATGAEALAALLAGERVVTAAPPAATESPSVGWPTP